MPQRIDAEAEASRELLLRRCELGPYRLHVDIPGDVDAVAAGVRSSLGIGERLV
jgi:hypothetical protein